MRIKVDEIHRVWRNIALSRIKDVLKLAEKAVLQPNEDTITLAVGPLSGPWSTPVQNTPGLAPRFSAPAPTLMTRAPRSQLCRRPWGCHTASFRPTCSLPGNRGL